MTENKDKDTLTDDNEIKVDEIIDSVEEEIDSKEKDKHFSDDEEKESVSEDVNEILESTESVNKEKIDEELDNTATDKVEDLPEETIDEDLDEDPESFALNNNDKNGRDYFEDDDEFLAGDDIEIHDGDVLSIFQQEEDVVSVEILNLYTPEGNLRNKFALRSDPPILEIKSSDGQVAQFVLTKNFAHGLSGKFEDAYSAYFGVESKSSKARKAKRAKKTDGSKMTFQDHFNDSLNWVQDNKIKTGIGVLVFLLVIFGLFF